MSEFTIKNIFWQIAAIIAGSGSIWFGRWTYKSSAVLGFLIFFIGFGIFIIIASLISIYETWETFEQIEKINEIFGAKDSLSLLKYAKKETKVQERAIRYIGILKDVESIDQLKEIIKNSSKNDIRIAGIESLLSIGGERVETILLEFLNDEEFKEVKYTIALSHVRLTGLDSLCIEILKKMKIDEELEEWEEIEVDEIIKDVKVIKEAQKIIEEQKEIKDIIETIENAEIKKQIEDFIFEQQKAITSLKSRIELVDTFLDTKQKTNNQINDILNQMSRTDDPADKNQLSQSLKDLQETIIRPKEQFMRYGFGRLIIEGILIAIAVIVGVAVG